MAPGSSSKFGRNKAEVNNLIKLAEKLGCCNMEQTKASFKSFSLIKMASRARTVASSIGREGAFAPISEVKYFCNVRKVSRFSCKKMNKNQGRPAFGSIKSKD